MLRNRFRRNKSRTPITPHEEVDVSSLGELRSLTKAARSTAPGGKRRLREKTPDNGPAYLFLLPWIIGLVVFTIGPMIASLWLSFTDYNLLRSPLTDPPPFIGLDKDRKSTRLNSSH